MTLTPQRCLHATEALAALVWALAAAQFLMQRTLLAYGVRPSHPRSRSARAIRLSGLRFLFDSPGVLVLLTAQLLSALAVLSCIALHRSVWPALLCLLVTALLWHLRDRSLIDAAGRLSLACLIPAFLSELPHVHALQPIALAFIAAQAALAYATAGLPKLAHRGWRDGSYLLYVLSTNRFGDACLHAMLDTRPRLAAWTSRAVLAAECLLIVAALLPPPLCAAVLCFGLLMHLTIARVMGLNTYTWAFAATYPATLWLSTRLYNGHL
jgi:hypothetical protein